MTVQWNTTAINWLEWHSSMKDERKNGQNKLILKDDIL